MKLKLDSSLNIFIMFIVIIKIIFVISALAYKVTTHTHRANPHDKLFLYIKERTEFVFIASMSMLLLYHFRPGHTHEPNEETSILFFLFGAILLFTADWGLFFSESVWLQNEKINEK